ncbi:MAG: hypothetical protein M0Z59_04970 [Nitrospiraceae bacterium]|nr:hypothetical protein [Nitrospiraceae bacterium]
MLFLFLCADLIPKTFGKAADVYLDRWSSLIFGLMALNLMVCTFQKIKGLSKPVLIIHVGVLLTLAGGVISSMGYIATVNVYEGTSVDTAYRWDVKKDMPLGFTLTLKKINMHYYPIPVKVGVLKGKEKAGLFVLNTGESFKIGQYSVRADYMEFPSEDLRLSVFEGDNLVGTADTGGTSNLPGGFPYGFRLVAYKTPLLNGSGLDLMLSRGPEVLAEGVSEINGPLTWKRLSFYNTQVEQDKYGLRYAGIQITDDPGKPYVFLGFLVMGIGSLVYAVRRLRGYKK